MQTIAYIALGSNLGQREENLERALGYLRLIEGIVVERVSSFIETAPVDAPQGSGAFLNAVARLRTTLSARGLLDALMAVEQKMGRERSVPNAPRNLDLDLLLYGSEVINEPDLEIPHPRMHERFFVLWPLLQIDSRVRDPRTGEPFADAYAKLPRNR
ncbi:MAG: 2-amino-4-hydroxy-6-hydroxymethyldihydropteridine diphosphokinase [Planctomycetes bacterium]|jgi:2-amino-4-hydroxy-6-hydroxymethyldihydropteridine diphosphokinase|nr:2-amino-4-hydroxy-6-hydroxymethyldihydropteridine diphosphokinase [Planctomycetota bacterium]